MALLFAKLNKHIYVYRPLRVLRSSTRRNTSRLTTTWFIDFVDYEDWGSILKIVGVFAPAIFFCVYTSIREAQLKYNRR